ncbi:hypothetical protein BH20VER3_BH20VER3_16000 [soil metagenome]
MRRVYPEEFRGRFFEIYIQGSKYNFLELSLNLNKLQRRSVTADAAESFSYQRSLAQHFQLIAKVSPKPNHH